MSRKQVRSPEEVKSPRTSFKAGGNQQEAEMTQRGNRASWMRTTSSYSITTVCSVLPACVSTPQCSWETSSPATTLIRLVIIKQTCSQSHDCPSYQARTENKESIGQNIYCWSLSQRRGFHLFYQQSSFAVSLLHAPLALLRFHEHMSCNVSLQNLCYDVPGYFALPFSLKRFLSTSFSVSGCPWHLANSSGQGDRLSHNQICVHLVNSTAKKRKWQYV